MASAEYSVLLPERVSLQYDIAGVGSRGAAAMIDTGIQLVALSIVFLAGGGAVVAANAAGLASVDRAAGIALLALVTLTLFAITNGYFIVFEIVWNGQTPGKRLIGVRVIREDGYPLRALDAVVRNLVRIVDWLPFGYAVGVAAMLLNNRARRLGDFAGGTIVIREGAPGGHVLVSSGAPAARGYTLSAADATLVRDFLVRRATMRDQPRAALAGRLAEVLARRYGLPVGDDPERFLEQLGG